MRCPDSCSHTTRRSKPGLGTKWCADRRPKSETGLSTQVTVTSNTGNDWCRKQRTRSVRATVGDRRNNGGTRKVKVFLRCQNSRRQTEGPTDARFNGKRSDEEMSFGSGTELKCSEEEGQSWSAYRMTGKIQNANQLERKTSKKENQAGGRDQLH
jgi:hypothetical protein